MITITVTFDFFEWEVDTLKLVLTVYSLMVSKPYIIFEKKKKKKITKQTKTNHEKPKKKATLNYPQI